AQFQHILQRDHRYARHRHEREPDQIPNDVVTVRPQVTESVVPLVGRATPEPAEGSVVVMRSGVHDRVHLVVVGKVRVVAAATERELQNPHSWVTELLPQRMDVRRYDPQILHDDRDRAQLALQTAEEVQTRTGYPRAVDRRLLPGRNLPPSGEPPEVVHPHQIHELKDTAEPVNPPAVAGGGQHIPTVARVTPELTGRGEVVGRNPGAHCRLARLIQGEEVLVRPDVGTVVGDVDRDVPHDTDAPLVG